MIELEGGRKRVWVATGLRKRFAACPDLLDVQERDAECCGRDVDRVARRDVAAGAPPPETVTVFVADPAASVPTDTGMSSWATSAWLFGRSGSL